MVNHPREFRDVVGVAVVMLAVGRVRAAGGGAGAGVGEADVGDAEDGAAVAAMAAGDQAGLRRLHARYGAGLLAYVRALVGDPGRAEEVVQDVLVAAWRQAGRFEGRGSVRGWLFAIARRRAVSAFQADPGRHETGPEALDGLPDDEPDPERIVLARAEWEQVAGALDRLPGHHREVLLLTCVAQLTGPEVGELLGIPVGTVKSRLSLARRGLARLLRREGSDQR